MPYAAIALTLHIVLGSAVAAPVTADPVGNANGEWVAVSVFGDATTDNGVSVSVFGDATNDGDDERRACGERLPVGHHSVPVQCIAVSGTGNASNGNGGSFSCIGPASIFYSGANCVAISGTGNASNGGDGYFACGSGGGVGLVNCVAISGTGNARNGGSGDLSCFDGDGTDLVAIWCVALSGTGDATNGGSTGSCRMGHFFGREDTLVIMCFAASGTGRAHNGGQGVHQECTWRAPGILVAQCTAVTLTGEASGPGESGTACSGPSDRAPTLRCHRLRAADAVEDILRRL